MGSSGQGESRGAGRGLASRTAAALCVWLVLAAAPAVAGAPETPEAPLAPFAVASPDAPHAMAAGSQSLESHSGYNSDYLFGMTRGVADSTLTPALKPLLFVLTIPLDVAFFPFALIGGFF